MIRCAGIMMLVVSGALVFGARAGEINYLSYELEPFYLDYEAESIDTIYVLLEQARDAVREEDWGRAGQLFSELNRIDETNPFYIYALGQIAYWRRDWGAVILLTEQVFPAPFTQDAFMMRGGALLNVGRYEEAAGIFQQILAVDPSVVNARRGLGAALLSMERYQEAIDAFKLVLAAAPDAIDAKVGIDAATLAYEKRVLGVTPVELAEMNFLHGDRKKAVDILLIEINKNPLNKEFHNRVGVFYASMGQGDLSKKHIEEAAKLSPKDPFVMNNLGVVSMHRHEDDQALEAFKQAIELDPNYLAAYRNLARLHLARGEWEQSVRAASQSLSIDGSSLPASLMAAYGSYRCGAYAEALRFLEPFMGPNSDRSSVWFLGGICAQLLGKKSEAAHYYRKGLALNSDNILALNNLADIILNDVDSTQANLADALEMAEKASALASNNIETIELTVDQIKKKKTLVEWQLMMSDFQ